MSKSVKIIKIKLKNVLKDKNLKTLLLLIDYDEPANNNTKL